MTAKVMHTRNMKHFRAKTAYNSKGGKSSSESMVSPRLRVSEAPSEYEVSRSSRWIRLPLIHSYYTQKDTSEECLGLETSAFLHSTRFAHHYVHIH